MAFIDLGKLKFNWQGTWNSGTAYETDDVVFHGSQTFVATADVAAGQAEPQANASWSLMAAGFNYRGTYSAGTTYYLHDVVTYGSALYMLEGIAETGSQTGVDPGSNPGSDNWEQLTPAPAANVMHAIGDMVFRNNDNQNARLPVDNEVVGLSLNIGESPKETYPSRQFTYTLNGTNGNVINTPGSIAAVTYNITTKNQRATNYVIDGTDRDGDINWEYDGVIRVNIGDTIVFDNTNTHAAHPMAIRVADGGASVSTGTYTGEGTATVTWVTTGVAAGTYYYQCQNHAGMLGQIIVESTENRQGSAGANGTMEVCRGKTYTITLDGLTSGLNYNLFNAAAPQAGVTNAITSGEGNSAPGGTAYSGSPVTFTFTPNETTPDTVYLSSASNTSDQVAITVNDLAYVPGWATPAADDSLVLDDTDASHTFTIATGNQTADRTWTLPTAAPSDNQIIQFATDGTISYTDLPSSITWNNTAQAFNTTITGIASTVRKITIAVVDYEGASAPPGHLKVGHAGNGGTLLSSGYVGSSGYIYGNASAITAWSSYAQFLWSTSYPNSGILEMVKVDANDNIWVFRGNASMSTTYHYIAAGYIDMGADVLDRIYVGPLGSSGTWYYHTEE